MPTADELLGPDVARELQAVLEGAAPDAEFSGVGAAAGRFDGLPLRERSDLLRDALLDAVPGDYPILATVVSAAVESPRLTGWMVWPVSTAVADRAVGDGSAEAFDDAMAMLATLTGRLTSEFAIRALLRHDLSRGLVIAQGWTTSTDEHVRRLASEGTRPYLPWGTRIPGVITDPAAAIPILDALYRDPSDYVRRSVANHLNDVSRHAPELVVETAQRWMADPDDTTAATVRHALRTLVKRGDPAALAILGFGPVSVEVDGPRTAGGTVRIGEDLGFTAAVRNVGANDARVAIDYVVHHRKANGKQTEKVFKLTTCTLAPGEVLDINRRHSFKVITTRKYHPGRHAIELQVNGERLGRAEFDLVASSPVP
ncbi:DNA alkylation repair protein [Gordonia sp. PDNC005]|uniref:DNA alkylation repair protein n=1 Tax=Gordonia sp. PDNC005 TaxID=2811424 RepID=UPI001963B5AB|nr:DNA alkylation repair protein [Gordonia sp. PDNC005]QRY62436.1 DNA alkylation repair protein [Gordonia sp. PDNC005]